MRLYHGSYLDIDDIDLEKCKPWKDFGKGFYLTTILDQAEKMAKKVGERYNVVGVVNTFECTDSILSDSSLNIKTFEKADEEWADFIYSNREEKDFKHNYDLVIGPIADDGLRDLLIQKRFGIISTSKLAEKLAYDKENIQWCFLTKRALKYLKKI